jgi:hypothetical protein
MKVSKKIEHVRRFFSRSALAASCLAAAAIGLADPASALTVGVGQTVDVTTSGGLAPLSMEGGELRIGQPSTGAGLAVTTTDAVLAGGVIDHWYAQSGVTTMEFFGTTSVPGGITGAFPADGMYLRASQFDTNGIDFINKGTFVQSGTGELTLMGTADFVGDLFSIYYFDNDRGIRTLGDPLGSLVNQGASFIKRSGMGTSVIDVPIVHTGGKFEIWQGSLALQAGGTYQNGAFYADAFGTNPGALHFSGGTHVFRGITTTESGSFRIDPGATVRAATTDPIVGPAGEWRQLGSMVVEGTLDIDGSLVENFGLLETLGAGGITGRPNGFMTAMFRNRGVFSGNIREIVTPPSTAGWIDVQNLGTFVVGAGEIVEVAFFFNTSGTLAVDGVLTNVQGGQLLIYGGQLSGTGIINGDVFVGGDETTALFKPGNSPGTMTIDGSYTQDVNGELELEIGGIAPGEFDVVDASGGLTFNEGTIRFERVPTYAGDVGAQIDFFAGSPISIGPNVAIVDNTGLGLDFDPSTGTATITVPEPASIAMLTSGLIGIVGIGRFARRGVGRRPGDQSSLRGGGLRSGKLAPRWRHAA